MKRCAPDRSRIHAVATSAGPRLLLGLLACLGAALSWSAPASASISPTSDADAISSSMSTQAGLVYGSSWPNVGAANPSSDHAAGIGTGFTGAYMPNDGASFGVMTTGNVELAAPPNDSSSAGSDNLQATRNVHDLSVLKLDVAVPPSANCLSFDLVFYSEEYPEYVGSQFNDGFMAELDANNWTYDPEADTVDAPNNFAFDENHNLLTVNSASFTSEGQTELQYDGSTQLLTAATPVSPGDHSLYLSLFDAGDGIYDSAVFLDNLRAEAVPPGACIAGARRLDQDGDALPDTWEEHGYDADGDGDVDVDLPAMGADPRHKDLFVELDAMKNLRLSPEALGTVRNAFSSAPVSNPDGTTGVNIHIDSGPESVMDPVTGAPWEGLSEATDIAFSPSLGFLNGSDYDWSAFDALKAEHFSPAREPIFHYALSVNRYGSSGSSGISRGIGSSDFIIALGTTCQPEGACPGPVKSQAGTFMHELGHNLGLTHGGEDNINRKPNYLSVMNYAFQFTGLMGGGVDYSRFDDLELPDLEEGALDEPVGFNTSVDDGLRTFIVCHGPFNSGSLLLVDLAGPVDFNCDADSLDTGLDEDLNGDGNEGVLRNYDDWRDVELRGGAVGGEGLNVLLPEETPAEEPSVSEIQNVSTILVPPPAPTTGGVDGVGEKAATMHGTVNPNGDPTTSAFFQYGTDASYGQRTPVQAIGGSGSTPIAAPLSGLTANTTYHYQLVAQSDTHLVYGADGTFRTGGPATQPGPPPSPPSQPPLSTVRSKRSKQKALKCRKGFKKKKVRGKARCVRHKKHARHRASKHKGGKAG